MLKECGGGWDLKSPGSIIFERIAEIISFSLIYQNRNVTLGSENEELYV